MTISPEFIFFIGVLPLEGHMKRLSETKKNETGIIKEINCSGAVKTRLLEMGVTAGCSFRNVTLAPLGDPLEIEVRGYKLSLRLDEAAEIIVHGAENDK